MGHKRKKLSERVADKTNKGFDESPFKNATADTPKGFSRIMFKKESMAQRALDKRQHSSSEDIGLSAKAKKAAAAAAASTKNANKNNKDGTGKDYGKQETSELRIQPGEKMFDFSRRVDDHMREKMMKATRDNTSSGSKKKKYFEKLKAKDQAKKLKQQEDKAYEEYETIQDEVAEAPPTFTAIPKKRKNDDFMANKKWKNAPGEEDFEDQIADLDKTKKRKIMEAGKGEEDKDKRTSVVENGIKKSRLKNLTPAGRRIIEEERKQAIENYRLMKARKELDRGGKSKQDDDAAADDAEAAAAGY
ncbi:hypothetical protein BGZ96_009064 [Linnemannia gamsii]|uniref:Nuclear speckle splicing regulatory protein 1 N-terminal domain-containing protein n=1 Tax=Linnemannia gamsii TaxID=64522 RepID=A0ABQ7JX59_9FUNG|nr:hypothetical protein BGZ96_009064 [Linnemannia gamsii]